MSKRRAGLAFKTAMTSFVFVMVFSIAAPVMAGTYLPDAGDLPKAVNVIDPDTGSNHIIREYVDGGLQVYTADVYCPGDFSTKVGELDFEYAAYKGRRATDPAGANTIGGAAIRGGFDLDPNFEIAPGHELRWLQTYLEDGANETVDGSPLYPEFGITDIEADLYDVPFDLLTTDINLFFESALVCHEIGTKKLLYMGSFVWGYDSDGAGNITASQVPAFWSSGLTPSFITTFEAAYPDWTLEQGCCIIPEPGTVFLLAMGLVAAHRRRRAA